MNKCPHCNEKIKASIDVNKLRAFVINHKFQNFYELCYAISREDNLIRTDKE